MADMRDLTFQVDADCPDCNGTGMVKEIYELGDGNPGKDQEVDHLCNCVVGTMAPS